MIAAPDKYIHTDEVHNLTSPGIIVPFIMNLLHPASVVDVGCGTGTFLKVFKESGVQKILGIDGSWVNHDQLHIHENEFMEADLEKPIRLAGKFDLVLCLEVAEHLTEPASDTIIQSLVSMGNVIVFSAAITLQGGQNHLNEQPIAYWQKKFARQGYVFYDVFRDALWNEQHVDWWYKQNMFLVMHESEVPSSHVLQKRVNDDILTRVHPDLLALHTRQKHAAQEKVKYLKTKMENIKSGNENWRTYGSMILNKCRSIFSSKKERK